MPRGSANASCQFNDFGNLFSPGYYFLLLLVPVIPSSIIIILLFKNKKYIIRDGRPRTKKEEEYSWPTKFPKTLKRHEALAQLRGITCNYCLDTV